VSDSLPRILVQSIIPDGWIDMFEVVGASSVAIRVRSEFMYEVGQTFRVQIQHNGHVSSAVVRVSALTGPADARITELEITERSGAVDPEGGATAVVATGRTTRKLTTEEVDAILRDDKHFADLPEPEQRRLEHNLIHRPRTCTE